MNVKGLLIVVLVLQLVLLSLWFHGAYIAPAADAPVDDGASHRTKSPTIHAAVDDDDDDDDDDEFGDDITTADSTYEEWKGEDGRAAGKESTGSESTGEAVVSAPSPDGVPDKRPPSPSTQVVQPPPSPSAEVILEPSKSRTRSASLSKAPTKSPSAPPTKSPTASKKAPSKAAYSPSSSTAALAAASSSSNSVQAAAATVDPGAKDAATPTSKVDGDETDSSLSEEEGAVPLTPEEWIENVGCVPESEQKPENTSLPVMLFVAAVEGSGHHAMRSLFETVYRYDKGVVSIDFDMFLQGFYYGTGEVYPPVSPKKFLEERFEWRLRSRFPQYFGKDDKGRPVTPPHTYIDTCDSFPEGAKRFAVSHPDLVYWNRYIDGRYFRVRYLILYREPALGTMSTLTRFPVQGTRDKQAREHEHNFIYLNTMLPSFPCCKTILVRSEDLVQDPESLAGPIQRLVPDISLSHMRSAIKSAIHTKKTHTSKHQSSQTYEVLKTFYEERQEWLWPELHSFPRPYVELCPRLYEKR